MHFRDVFFPFCRSWILNYIVSFSQIRCQIGLCIHSFNHVFSSGFSGVPFDRENSLRMNTLFFANIYPKSISKEDSMCACDNAESKVPSSFDIVFQKGLGRWHVRL